jgi:hypothetical protein
MNDTMNGGSAEFRPIWTPTQDLGSHEAAVAYNPSAPENEAVDATTKLSQLYAPAMGAVDPGLYEMMGQFADLQRVERKAEDVVAKAMRFRDDPEGWRTGDQVSPEGKAQTTSWGSDFGRGYFKWLPKKGVQLPILRAFARRLEVAQAIIRTRIRQVDRYSRRAQTVDDIGWRLVMNEENATAGEDLEQEIRWLSKMLECGGREFNAVKRRELRRQGLVQFHRFMVGDGLTLDQAAVELIGLNGAEGLDSWFVRPSDTFALASPAYKATLDDGRPIYAYQVLNGKAEIAFGYDELALWTRNASTWAEENGYGYSEFEQSLETLNNVLQALTYTKQGLSDGAIPKGILMAYGNYDVRTQNAFQAAWQQKVRGIQNSHNLPILFSRGQQGNVQYLQTAQPFDEMAFSKWITLNMTIMGAIFGVAAEEVGFESFVSDKSSLSGDDTGQKLAAAKDKGLNPLLKDLAAFDNDEIVSRCSNRLHLEFCGLDIEQTKERWAEKMKHMTINEARAQFDLPPHPLDWFGNMPADKGEMDSHFQRVQAGLTVGEFRMSMNLPDYPSPMVNASPMNPSLGTIYQQALMVPPDGAEDPDADGEGEDGGASNDSGQPEGADGQPSELAQRLQRLGEGRTAYEPMPEPESAQSTQE